MDLRKDLPELPKHMKSLPLDPERGYPVPWFVEWIDGKPEFRVVDERKRIQAVKEKRCWVCGKELGAYMAFVIGPMCAVNRTSGDAPSHRDCAEFSAKGCPFLVKPQMERREAGLPKEHAEVPGMIHRNPGVTAVWITKSYRIALVEESFVFRIGEPTEVLWYREGRLATRAEVIESVESGLPILKQAAEQEGKMAVAELEWGLHRAAELFPKEEALAK